MNDMPHPLKRWGHAILAVLESPEDVRTVEAWSKLEGRSTTQLRATCRFVGIEAKRSLDFARLFRASLHREDTSWPLEFTLDVSDKRTLDDLLLRVGCSSETLMAGADTFIESQTVVTNRVQLDEVLKCVSAYRKNRAPGGG